MDLTGKSWIQVVLICASVHIYNYRYLKNICIDSTSCTIVIVTKRILLCNISGIVVIVLMRKTHRMRERLKM